MSSRDLFALKVLKMFDFITESLNSVIEKVKGVEHTFTFLIIFS